MRGDAAPRVGESNHGRLRSTWVSFPLRVKRGRGSRRGCGAAPRPLPACPTAQLGRCGAGGGTADPGGHRIPREPSTHGSCGAEGLLPGESSPPDSRRSPLDGGGGGPDGSPSAQGKSLSPGAGAPRVAPSGRGGVGGKRSPGCGAAAGRWSREEGKAEARLVVRIVIFHQSAAICVSAPDRTPAVLLAGVTETTQRWRRANCICSPAHRSKLRPSHGAGKGAKGPCDMREI